MEKVQWMILGVGMVLLLSACDFTVPSNNEGLVDTLSNTDTREAKSDTTTSLVDSMPPDQTIVRDTPALPPAQIIETGQVQPEQVMAFAETLMGTPYVYASTNPKVGFDCSGFITYVFNHFNIRVPRSSIDFTNVGKPIPVEQAKRGDIILFTGTDSTERFVGHMGLVVANTDTLRFIHSTSGKAMGVTITPLSKYYRSRFVKTIRIFPQNDSQGLL
ncbi:C40 family peptidase [Flavisolibacter tropicus]|nr:C40 family peptidase [Flavisolibacter tropicus]